MQVTCHCQTAVALAGESADLPGMIATLGSYDRLFGPRHLRTLSLAARVAKALSASGDTQSARYLLERVVRDLAQSAGRAHATRISVLTTLRDLLLQRGEAREAIAAQTEIAECAQLLAGPDAPEAVTARSDLGTLLMLHSEIGCGV